MTNQEYNKLIGRTITKIAPIFNLNGSFEHYVFILDDGTCLNTQDSEYGGNAMFIHKNLKEYLGGVSFYTIKKPKGWKQK